MKILLTGSTGFIGGNVRDHLLKFSRPGAIDKLVLPCRRGSCDDTRADVWHGDLRDAGFVYTLPKDITHVINCASEAQVGEAMADPAKHMHSNTAIMLNLLQAARYMPDLKSFIHLSTNEVNATELSPYGASKAAQEMMCRAWRDSYDVPTWIVRTRSVFGPGQQRTKFIPTVVHSILRNEPIRIFGNIDTARAWHHVDELCNDLTELLREPSKRRPADSTVGSWSRDHIRHVDLIAAVEEQLHLPALITVVPDDGRYAAGEPEVEAHCISTFTNHERDFATQLQHVVKDLTS